MTRVEYAVVLSVKQSLSYELSRYQSSLEYWTTGKGASNAAAKKSIDFCNARIVALQTAIEQIDMLRPE